MEQPVAREDRLRDRHADDSPVDGRDNLALRVRPRVDDEAEFRASELVKSVRIWGRLIRLFEAV